MKLCIIDDSSLFRDRLREDIQAMGGIRLSCEAETAAEAIRVLEVNQPDVVILDLRLRIGSGMDVLRAVRTWEMPPRILVATNHPEAHYRSACMGLGADSYFHKPTEYDDLLSRIDSVRNEVPGFSLS